MAGGGAGWPTGWHPSCVPQLFAAMTRVCFGGPAHCSCKVHENAAHSRAWTARIPHTQSVGKGEVETLIFPVKRLTVALTEGDAAAVRRPLI